jgi:hypothetical protein
LRHQRGDEDAGGGRHGIGDGNRSRWPRESSNGMTDETGTAEDLLASLALMVWW